MQPLDILQPWYYSTAYFLTLMVLCWFTVLYTIGSNQQKILYAESSPMQGAALFLTLLVIVFIGLRPSGASFGDMSAYKNTFNIIKDYTPVSLKTEWLWNNIMILFKNLGFNVHEFFLFISFVYFGGMFFCSMVLMRQNLWLAMLFFLVSFSTFSFSTNGIRNGFACSIELMAISCLTMGKSKYPLALILMFLALGTHRSTMLPTVSAFASIYFIKDTKIALRFWVASIGISLVAGPIVEQFFAALGFDDRMSEYSSGANNEQTMSQFTQTGFRWDFLFYSMFPVIMTWYVTKRRHFNDPTFSILANTYIFCNAFWIMVIRSSFSNRFAYLSWFLYPVVIAYPLFRMNVWKDQDRKTAIILFFYSAFTFFMFFIYYYGSGNGFRGFDLYWWRE